MGLFLIWRHKLIYTGLTLCKHAYTVDCDVKSGVDPLPFWLGREQKMLFFFAGFEAYNIHFSEKKYIGVRGTLKLGKGIYYKIIK